MAALEVMGRFAVNPKWLVYLPPAVSPPPTSKEEGLLEHPAEAFSYYRHEGVARVICEEKHMGSRAIVVVCKDEQVARRRFGVVDEGFGVCYTRTGRRFFDDPDFERSFLDRVRAAAETTGLFSELETEWLILDAELLPWSAKAQQLLREQYAAVGSAGRVALAEAVAALSTAEDRIGETDLTKTFAQRLEDLLAYTDAYRRYCWPVQSLNDLKLAPFHLLASEGAVHLDKPHDWHMGHLHALASADGELLRATANLEVDTTDPESEKAATRWWTELTESGGEGMVVKPMEFIARGRRGLAQPAVKVRGKEYLRIIYGPEYAEPQNLERLRERSIGAKRSLAVREFALGAEALERFVREEPLEDVADDDAERQLDERDGDARLDRHHARNEHDRRQRCGQLNRVHPAPPLRVARRSVEAISPGAGG